MAVKIFHFAALVHFAYSLYYHVQYIAPHEMKLRGYTFGGSLVYLTILASVVQVIYLTVALLHDFTGSAELKKTRDYIFGTLSFPLGLETTFMYWSMRMVDRELVFPKALDEFFPLWLDVALHTNVTLFVLIELFLVKHRYPERKLALKGLTTFMIVYLMWLLIIKGQTGRWVYHLFEALPYPQRIAFFALSGVFTNGLYFIGEFLNKLCTGGEKISEKKKTK